jgi:glycosyltransferase involved in cell wall biosynthesis
MKTAVVHDWLNGMRGGEKVLEAILPLVPEPTIFTLFHVPGSVSPAIERHPIRASWLNRLPFSRRHYRNFLPFFSSAVEAFDLSGFDLVVSSSHCVAKGALARPGAPHLCYCHTPVRYAWDQFDVYFPEGRTHWRSLKAAAIARLRAWDLATASRPSRYLANSSAVAERIARHYGRESRVCHPPVDVEFYRPSDPPAARGDFLLAVGALVPYKRFDAAIETARRVSRPLVIVGRGPEEPRLEALAEGARIELRASLAPEELRELYRTCAAYLQPGEEDFGISAVEALACGAPVAALGRGGVRDVVRDGENGALCESDDPDALAGAVLRALASGFDYTRLRASALPFRAERFAAEFRGALGELVG